MKRIDHHVHFEKEYKEENLLPYIEKAKELSLDELHILEHSHKFKEFKPIYEELFNSDGIESEWIKKKFKNSIYDYISFIKEVQAKDYGIPIRFGLEICYFENKEQEIRNVIALHAFDFLIGSVHFIDGFGYDIDNQDFSNKDINRLYKRYFELEIKAIKSGLFNIIGHPDALKLCDITPDIDLFEYYDELTNCAAEMNVALDMNSGLYYRYHVNHLGIDSLFLKLAKLNGASIVPSSDAHKYDDLGKYIDCMLRATSPETTSVECNDNLYITDDFQTFEVYDKTNGKLDCTFTFKPHTQKGSVMMHIDKELSDIQDFFNYMHEYYHVNHIIATVNGDASLYERMGMKKLYTKGDINYYNLSF